MAGTLDDSLEAEEVSMEQSSGSSTSSRELRKYFDQDGEIGFKKGQSFIPVTNFSMKCTGYVARDESATSADGFLVEVIAKKSVRSTHASKL